MFLCYNPFTCAHLNEAGEASNRNGKHCNHVSKERQAKWEKQKQKSPPHSEARERQRRVCTLQTDFPRHVNHFTGKNTGLTQLARAFSDPAEVLTWCGPCCSPQTLFPSSFLTVEKQEGMFINKTDGSHWKQYWIFTSSGLGKEFKAQGPAPG